eukprot:2818297-Rhodomonas_salina.1
MPTLCAGDCRRGRGAVLLRVGVGVRGDVRGSRSAARARPLRLRQAQVPVHPLHRRDRRHRCGPKP